MRTLARLSPCSLLLVIACNGGQGDGESTDAMPTTMGTAVVTGTTAAVSTTDAPTTTGLGSTTAAPESSTGVADSSGGDESGTTEGEILLGPWLLTVDNGSNPPRLMRVGLDGGSTPICSLAATVDYTSVIFARDGTLYGHNAAANRIDVVDPCNCSFQIVGPTSLGSVVLSLGPADDDDLLAIDTDLDALARVDVGTGLATAVGALGFFFGPSSIAWSDLIVQPYVVEGDNDFLYSVAVATGESMALWPLSIDVTSPGLAVHPNDNGLYLCDGDMLYTVDPSNGMTLPVGSIGLEGSCQTLSPPQTAVDCIDRL
ncbi:MAG: hypothetical protein K0V04_27765 [Deltaproteobacteria bacterium]|nr:hypothetical protein [Deltaproteobacteria bacterium]